MTAQAQSPEPPSPKATSKKDKLPTTSRQKKFHRHFPAVDCDEKVLNCKSNALRAKYKTKDETVKNRFFVLVIRDG